MLIFAGDIFSFNLIEQVIISVIGAIVIAIAAYYRKVLVSYFRELFSKKSETEFIFTDSYVHSNCKVYVAGSFNNWLQAKDGHVKPFKFQKRRYSMNPVEDENGELIWKRKVKVPIGLHNFKFVVNNNYWVAWSDKSRYNEGHSAPGGSNFFINVK